MHIQEWKHCSRFYVLKNHITLLFCCDALEGYHKTYAYLLLHKSSSPNEELPAIDLKV
jgi:hypothetical protein